MLTLLWYFLLGTLILKPKDLKKIISLVFKLKIIQLPKDLSKACNSNFSFIKTLKNSMDKSSDLIEYDINHYILKITEMGYKYHGPYQIDHIKNFYYSTIVNSELSKPSLEDNSNKLKSKKFYITTPIYYTNGSPHIGHVYTNIVADVIARFQRSLGKEVKFLTGTDEHGEKVNKTASQLNLKVQDFVDEISGRFRESTKKFNISNDDFIRTTEPRHIKYVQKVWKKLVETGWIYKSEYEGWYSVRDESFYSESEIIDGKAPTGAPVEWIKEPTYFFKLEQCKNFLIEFYEKNPDFIYPHSRLNEVLYFIKHDLKDLSISRLKKTFTWGIEVPNDETQVIYVWLDALMNYMSAIVSDTSYDNGMKSDLWPCNVHIIGKDILKFHAVYWLAFLHALNLEMPKKILAHGWWLNNGEKMSKSLNNVIDPLEIIKDFEVDTFRYFLLREASLGHDGNFSKLKLAHRLNSELGNKLGNLVQRTAIFIHKKMLGIVPNIESSIIYETQLLKQIVNHKYEFIELMLDYKLTQGLDVCIKAIDDSNSFMESQAPWKNKDLTGITLYSLLETIRYIAIMMQCFLPDTCAKIFEMLNLDSNKVGIKSLNQNHILPQGTQIKTIPLLFPRDNSTAESLQNVTTS